MKSVRVRIYSVGMWENTDQNNSEYEHFLQCSRTYKLLKNISFL